MIPLSGSREPPNVNGVTPDRSDRARGGRTGIRNIRSSRESSCVSTVSTIVTTDVCASVSTVCIHVSPDSTRRGVVQHRDFRETSPWVLSGNIGRVRRDEHVNVHKTQTHDTWTRTASGHHHAPRDDGIAIRLRLPASVTSLALLPHAGVLAFAFWTPAYRRHRCSSHFEVACCSSYSARALRACTARAFKASGVDSSRMAMRRSGSRP